MEGNLHPEEEEQIGVLLPATICPRVRSRSPTLDTTPRSGGHGKKKKRRVTSQTRNTRFSMEENRILIEKVVENWDKLFGHFSRQLPFSAKTAIWKEVVEAVNAADVTERNIDTCKRRLNDIKRQVKGKLTELSKHRKGTGGDPPPEVAFFEYEEKLRDYVGPDVAEGAARDNDSDFRVLTEQGPALTSSRPETPANLDTFHCSRHVDEDSIFLSEEEDHSSSPTTSVQPEDTPMARDTPSHRLSQSTEKLEEASSRSVAAEHPEEQHRVREAGAATEKAPSAVAQRQQGGHLPVRTPVRRRKTLLQRRLAESTGGSNHLQDALGKLVDAFRKQTQESQKQSAAVTEAVVHELRQTNRSLHQIAVTLDEHRNVCSQLLEEQRKISVALLALVGNVTQPGSGGPNRTPNLPDV